ncbi:hypothetical protein [Sorangium sp. So ce1153]|uniref:hypothetical protein n=1 Tax=Sorangium sp. So ce1153 TaxID=3133333 RepID=UPI003F60964A
MSKTNRLLRATHRAAAMLGLAGTSFGPTTHRNIVPFFPAGGRFAVPRERLYLEQMTYMLSNGRWGLFRVVPR